VGGRILNIAIFKKLLLERTMGNVATTEVDVLVYVVLSRAEKHVPYGELVVTMF
jgi:hypothetical protein